MIKAIHVRPDPNVPTEECMLRISLQPLRLNVDQVGYLARQLSTWIFWNIYMVSVNLMEQDK